jgi:trimethylamine--corrinoid protein Co-methyltransferase
MDTLGDSYGSMETSQYHIDCTQLARYYKLPNYSTSGVCDPKIPGQQSTVERLISNIMVTLSGPQFLHCAFGLLDCNSVFSLLQTVIDDAHFKMIKYFLNSPQVDKSELEDMVKQVRDVMATPQKMFINYIRPVMRSGGISSPYPFESDDDSDSVLELANRHLQELLAESVKHIDRETTSQIFDEVPGLLPRLNPYQEVS